MSEGYSITVKLSPYLEKYVKSRGDFLGQSYKSVVIDAITRMAETDGLPYQNSTKSTIESTADSAPNQQSNQGSIWCRFVQQLLLQGLES